MNDFSIEATKPDNWPANERELMLDRIFSSIESFLENPNYLNKEILVSMVSNYDLNQISTIGLHRVTDYEVSIINSLYIYATIIQLHTLKVYLYDLIGMTTRSQKMVSQIPEYTAQSPEEIYQGLLPSLNLYFHIYLKYTIENSKSFTEQIVEFLDDEIIKDMKSEDIQSLTSSYVQMIYDLSYFRSKKRSNLWAFSRAELLALFKLEAKLLCKNNDSIVTRPLRGMLNITISNFILKSRNDYNEDYIVKYLSTEVAENSLHNHEIWMQRIEYLNDDRELKILPELFGNRGWLEYKWVDEIDFSAKRDYFVTCFSKSYNNSDMVKNYGECIYGYKDDRIAELVAPIYLYGGSKKRYPLFSQVVSFDVLYDILEIKEEINYLCAVIDEFNLQDEEKSKFLEEILQYWILSVKDEEWKNERERRYVLFLYDGYEYTDLLRDDRFLKLKTALFYFPDFMLGENPGRLLIKEAIDSKRKSIYRKDYMFCENCFSCDFDSVYEKCESCPICGSTHFIKESPRHHKSN